MAHFDWDEFNLRRRSEIPIVITTSETTDDSWN